MAGGKVTILRPIIRVAPVGSKLPANTVPAGGAWPAAWVQVENTEEGALITASVPKEDINSDENGTIAVVPEGADQINISFQSKTPEMSLIKYLSQLKEETVAGTYEVQTITATGAADAGGGTANVTLYQLNGQAKVYEVTLAALDTTSQVATKIAAAINADADRQWQASASSAIVTLTAKHYFDATQCTFTDVDSGVTATTATTTPGVFGYRRFSLDKQGRTFMIGIEGTYEDDTLFDAGGMVRAFGYEVEQTEDSELSFRTRGADAAMSPVATVRCRKTNVSSTQLVATGITSTDDRFDIFAIGQ